ncbi:MAG TPA: PD-(D/E)XK nuclease family protein, partial [Methanocorpusculum sp.]|nr:PD-(D/E)XK nuclease family protein [Methanocorpusculum sp.]
HLLFAGIAKKVRDLKTIPDTETENLINLFITLKTHRLTLPSGTPKYDTLKEIFLQYETFCRDENSCDSILAIERAADLAPEVDIGTVICYQLYKPTPLAANLLLSLPGAIRTLPPLAENLTTLPPAAKSISLYPDTLTELRSTLEQISSLIESGVPQKDIALLTPSLTSTLPVLAELAPDFSVLREGIRHPLRFTAGEDIPIENLPPVRCALAWLSAFAFDFGIEDLKIIIESPYFNIDTNRLTAGTLEKAGIITKTEKGKAAWADIGSKLTAARHSEKQKAHDAEFQKSLDELIARLDANLHHTENLAEHCTSLRTDLSALGWTDREMKPQDEAARHAFLRLLGKLEQTSLASRKYTIREFYTMLCRFCEKTTKISYPESENAFRAGDLRSVAGTRIPYVFITGLSSDNLPKIEATIPLLNSRETALIQPDRVQNMLDSSLYYFHAAMLAAEKELTLSCPASDGERTLTVSPYLTRFAEPEPKSPEFFPHSLTANQKRAGKNLAEGKARECADLFGIPSLRTAAEIIGIETVDRTGPPGIYDANFANDELAAEFAEAYREKTDFAPTVLERYKECPFKWYLSNHLYLENPADFSAERIIVGTVMHKAMEQFFREFTKPLTRENRTDAIFCLKKIVKEEFADRNIKTPSWQALLNGYLGEGGLESSIDTIIGLEIGFYNEGYRTPEEWLERNVTAKIGDEEFTVSGRADRVMFNGQTREFMVIDYKTGKVKTKTELTEGKALQLPLYTEGVAQETGCLAKPGTYLMISYNDAADKNPYFSGKKQAENVAEIRDMAFETCRDIREMMKKGQCAPISADECPDDYCPYRRICRFVPFKEVNDD